MCHKFIIMLHIYLLLFIWTSTVCMANPNPAMHHGCTMCPFECESFAEFSNHVKRIHRNDPRFKVYCEFGGCAFSTKSWPSFKVHISTKHRRLVEPQQGAENDYDWLHDSDDNEDEIDDIQVDDVEPDLGRDKMLMASYSLFLETKLRITEKAVDCVVENTYFLINHHLRRQKINFKRLLQQQQQPFDLDLDVNDIAYETSYISEFDSKYKRDKFYKEHCRMVEPVQVVLGYRNKEVNGQVKVVRARGYVVPLQQLLQSLINLPEVQYVIKHPHNSRTEHMFDVCDGEYIQNHPLFGTDRKSLQLALYTDDIEIVNPLGTRIKKHKLTLFYATLMNMPPENRSRLSAIYLVAVARSCHLKRYGFSIILKDFIDTINRLSSAGIEFNFGNNKQNIKGSLVAVLADTPASNLLGGFKESVGHAHKPCRSCHIQREELKQKVLLDQCQLRTQPDHRDKCALLFDQPLTRAAQREWSKRWGINSKSVLLSINDFDICTGLLHDPMHVYLEGAVPYELALFLFHCIEVNSFFTLPWLNNQLETYPYTYLERKNKPEAIQKTQYYNDVKIKQTSACMLNLCTVLPFILAKTVPHDDTKFSTLLMLFQMTHLSCSPCATLSTSTDLEYLIEAHHRSFMREYPRETFKPKLHYMMHIANAIRLFGPGRMHWCMRFEAKHQQFKCIKWNNFKNLPKSLAVKHQRWLCLQMFSPTGLPSENYLYEGDSVNGGEEKCVVLLPNNHRQVLSQAFPGIATIYIADSVVIHGSIFKAGCVLVCGYDEQHFPKLVWLESIYVLEHKKYFLCRRINVVDFVEVVNAYEIEPLDDVVIVTYKKLFVKLPLSIHLFENRPHVCNKYGYQSHLI